MGNKGKHKGEAGYWEAKKKRLLAQSLVSFGFIGCLFLAGYFKTGTRLNFMTFLAVMCCLPASKLLVGLIACAPYRTIDKELYEEIEEKAGLLTTVYDTALTSRESIMAVDAFVIFGNTVCGYVSGHRTDIQSAAGYLKDMLEKRGIFKVTVKVFSEYGAFLARIEGMNSIAKIEGERMKSREEQIKGIILNLSM